MAILFAWPSARLEPRDLPVGVAVLGRLVGAGDAAQPVGLIGQLMPPGAGSNLLRSTGYFDGAGAWQHVAVLAGWAALGLALLAFADVRARVAARRSPLKRFREIVAA